MELTTIIVGLIGGLGMFLLGMTLMTEGLKATAGDAIRTSLMQVTRSPLSGALTGVLGTAVLQSSTATIIATVGFVGAGLLSFYQALSIILGSALGTTFTGWLVAVVGFKFQFGTLATVLIFIGAFMRLFGGRRFKGVGYALAGFGLIFVGIAGLQAGLSGLQGYVDFTRLSADTLWGKLQLVLIGVIFTILTQSSSAGVVAALTAVFTGAIAFEQAAALVVGMNIGTSFTAAAATIGGNIHVRRTGFSHVLYNTFVSSVALFLIAPYIWLWEVLSPGRLYQHAEFALVGFHTAFNLLGIVLVLPFVKEFARLVERLFPERPYGYQQVLDRGLLKFPELALTAVQKVLLGQADTVAQQLAYILGDVPRATSLTDNEQELNDIQEYIDSIHLDSTSDTQWERLLAAIQIVDHLQRLLDRCGNKSVQVALHNGDDLGEPTQLVRELVNVLQRETVMEAEQVRGIVAEVTALEEVIRERTMQHIAQGHLDLKVGVSLMEVARWLQHVAMHIERIVSAHRQLNYQSPGA
jgi:phosphate:Na+ symporter